ncbi:hypothetical protein ACTXT7_001433 [Hymenolepis weldensis]
MNYLITALIVHFLVVLTLSAPAKLSSSHFALDQEIKMIEFHLSNLDDKRSWTIDSGKESPVLFKVTLLESNFVKLDSKCLNCSHIAITDSNNNSVAYFAYLKNRELRIFSKTLKFEIISSDNSQEYQYAKFSYEIIDPGTQPISPLCSHIKEGLHKFWPCKTQFYSDNFSDTVCIPSTEICDGIIQCPGSEDENAKICEILNSTSLKLPPLRNEESIGPVSNESCPNNTFYCHNDAKCITFANVCDGAQDCLGNTDESSSACDWKKNKSDILEFNNVTVVDKSTSCTEDLKFLCPVENTCLPVSVVCNGIIDCSDGFDEGPQVCKAVGNLGQKQSRNDILVSTDENVAKIPYGNEIDKSTTTAAITASESADCSMSTSNQVENSQTASDILITKEEISESTEVLENKTDKRLEKTESSDSGIDTTHEPNTDLFTTPTIETSIELDTATQILTENPFTESNEILVETSPNFENASWTAKDDALEDSSIDLWAETETFENSQKSSDSSAMIHEIFTSGALIEKSNQTATLMEPTSELEEITPESALELSTEALNSTIEPVALNLKKSITPSNEKEEIVFPPLWIARVSSGSFFLCYGMLLDLESTSRWVLIPSSCGQYLEPSSMRVHFGAGIDKYEIQAIVDLPVQIDIRTHKNCQGTDTKIVIEWVRITARVNQQLDNQIADTRFGLLRLNSSESIKHFIPQGISLNNSSLASNNTETTCKLLAPRHGYIYSFQVHSVHQEDPITCKQKYERGDVVSCFSQNLCLQSSLGGILTCSNSTLGFYVEGADCYQGQIGWPVVASLVTPEIINWIKYTTSMVSSNLCGYAPNEKSQSFPWYTYFNRTQSSEGLCLVAYVKNDTFPLVTSVQCLKQCMNSIPPREGEESGCELESYGTDMDLCPAKNIAQRLSTPRSPWTQCLIAYIPSPNAKEIRYESVRVGAFKDCDGEGFYNPFMANTSLCVRALEDDGVLNCSSWGEAGLVQCKRSSDGLWEFLGFTKSCPARKPRRRWFIRSMEL